jgi:hydrogenase expression/formation protein
MSDLEGLARTLVKRWLYRSGIVEYIVRELSLYKDLNRDLLYRIGEAIYDEVEKSISICRNIDSSSDIICPYTSGVKAGEMGIGSRGFGDFYFHSKIREVAFSKNNLLIDDAGWIKIGDLWIIAAIDGIHSRLAYFPLIAGFHAARAAARDVLVKGGLPFGFLIDLRIADDGDPSFLLEVEAGVSAVSKFLSSPILSGSTLRIGGDMVIGERIVGTVGCIGFSKTKPLSRLRIDVGDKIVMTEGSGGGTISTAAIFEGYRDVVEKTLNFNTLGLLYNLVKNSYIALAKSLFDVTNGGLRGDLHELSKSSGLGFVIDTERIEDLIDGDVLEFLKRKSIDPLGVSLDSIVFIVDDKNVETLLKVIESYGVKADVVGEVISDRGVYRYVGHSDRYDFTNNISLNTIALNNF